jgi:hypothetical protein
MYVCRHTNDTNAYLYQVHAHTNIHKRCENMHPYALFGRYKRLCISILQIRAHMFIIQVCADTYIPRGPWWMPGPPWHPHQSSPTVSLQRLLGTKTPDSQTKRRVRLRQREDDRHRRNVWTACILSFEPESLGLSARVRVRWPWQSRRKACVRVRMLSWIEFTPCAVLKCASMRPRKAFSSMNPGSFCDMIFCLLMFCLSRFIYKEMCLMLLLRECVHQSMSWHLPCQKILRAHDDTKQRHDMMHTCAWWHACLHGSIAHRNTLSSNISSSRSNSKTCRYRFHVRAHTRAHAHKHTHTHTFSIWVYMTQGSVITCM